ncbi:hypothetical protein AAFP35_22265 [Gordonia sp. CPCC 206044]
MNTPFGGHRQRGRNRELPLSEFPAWGLEVMMGLYGPETVQKACADERVGALSGSPAVGALAPPAHSSPPADRIDDTRTTDSDATQVAPIGLQLEAVNELVRYIERRLRHHH